jgi:hypothetical protein
MINYTYLNAEWRLDKRNQRNKRPNIISQKHINMKLQGKGALIKSNIILSYLEIFKSKSPLDHKPYHGIFLYHMSLVRFARIHSFLVFLQKEKSHIQNTSPLLITKTTANTKTFHQDTHHSVNELCPDIFLNYNRSRKSKHNNMNRFMCNFLYLSF